MNPTEFKIAHDAIKVETLSYSLEGWNKSNKFDAIRDKYMALRQQYAIDVAAIAKEIDEVKEIVRQEIQNMRATIKWNYTMKCGESDKSGKTWYTITATPDEIVSGDEEYYKVRQYQSFTIVNNVLIINGGGYVLPVANGDILAHEEIFQIYEMKVPKRFIK